MESKLERLRGELISEIKGFVKCNGYYDKEQNRYEFPTYKGQDGISIEHNAEDVYCLSVATVPAAIVGVPSLDGATITRIIIETNDDYYYAEDIFADDLDSILNFIKTMNTDDRRECRQWYDEYNGVA